MYVEETHHGFQLFIQTSKKFEFNYHNENNYQTHWILYFLEVTKQVKIVVIVAQWIHAVP
jgi:hypothetical protein